jgi:hypothetical protein
LVVRQGKSPLSNSRLLPPQRRGHDIRISVHAKKQNPRKRCSQGGRRL